MPHGNLADSVPQSARTDGSLASLNYTEECPHLPEEMSILEIALRRRKAVAGPSESHMVSPRMEKQ